MLFGYYDIILKIKKQKTKKMKNEMKFKKKGK